MSKDTDKNFFIVSPLAGKYAGLYQQLLSGIASYQELGNRIIKRIKAAHAFRQTEIVRELSSILANFPVTEYQLIGRYYLVWSECRKSKYEVETLERIAEQTQTYKTQALTSRAAFEVYNNRLELALHFYTEALKTAPIISEYIALRLGISVIKGIEGFHASALKDMENVIPLIQHAEPQVFFNFHNSYATELAVIGRKSEARNISQMVMASPFAPFYPEWRETGMELGVIEPKEPRCYVSLKTMPEPTTKSQTKVQKIKKVEPKSETQTGSVIAFPVLKEAPQPQKPERLKPQQLAELTENDKRELILTALRSGAISGNEYDKLLSMVGLLESGPADKVLDLEDSAVLDDLIVIWSHQVDPEELAAVMSALRDCEDRIRQMSIMDRIIRIAFEETQLCGVTEDAWRLRVERRLP